MGFLDNYLTVNQKIKLLHEKYPNHRLIPNIIEHDLAAGYVLIMCDFYRDANDSEPAYRDFAYGNVAFYPNQMKRWFVEDTSTSVQGRVAAVALALDEKPNRETMEQIERVKSKDINADDQGAWGIKAAEQELMPTAALVVEQIAQNLGGEMVVESPICAHGHMIFRTGEKNGREWGGWYCTEKQKANQCPVVWAVRSATTGNWRMA
jgi:hypothetical protein